MTVWAAEGECVAHNTELYLLRSFAEQATGGGTALLLTGKPGAGTTALLQAASPEAEEGGAKVLAAAGVEFEAQVSCATLDQLLLPVLHALAPVHRGALSTASPALLRQVAATRPVLVLVDDLPWLDRANAGVLGFVGGRLTGLRIGFPGAARSGLPLTLLELPRALPASRGDGLATPPATLPLSRHLQALVAVRLPEVPPATRRVSRWPLAEPAGSPDARAADLLDQAARRALRTGDAVQAVSVLLRAADLTPFGPDRARRLAEAAYLGAEVTGHLREVPRLLAEARRADPDIGGSLRAAVATAYHLLNGNGDVDTAHRILVSAIEATPRSADDETALHEALHTLLLVCSFSGRDSPWRPFEAAVGRLDRHVPTTLALSAATFADPARATAATLDLLDTALADAHDEADPTRAVRGGIAAFYVDRLSGVRDALWRVVRDGRAGGAVASQVSALMMLCHDALQTGRWDDAQRWAEEGVELADAHGYHLVAWPGWHCLAVLAAARGDDRNARRRADEMAAWAAPRGARTVEQYAVHARLIAASARGDFEEAYRQATTIGPAGEFPRHVPIALWVALDLVEAAVRTGRRAEAAAHVTALRQLELAELSPRLALVAAGAAGMADLDGAGAADFEQALCVPGGTGYPFEQARVRLAYGEHLRRAREPGAARLQLTEALQAFRRLGAEPWAVRAAKELRATGGNRSPAGARDWTALTPQEEEIALLAASGLSNKEIAARLYLSPRTVGAHLYRVFPKLGVTARAALRDALTARCPDGGRPARPPARPA